LLGLGEDKESHLEWDNKKGQNGVKIKTKYHEKGKVFAAPVDRRK
jgi:hypothetical protein